MTSELDLPVVSFQDLARRPEILRRELWAFALPTGTAPTPQGQAYATEWVESFMALGPARLTSARFWEAFRGARERGLDLVLALYEGEEATPDLEPIPKIVRLALPITSRRSPHE